MKNGKPSVEDVIAIAKYLEEEYYGELFRQYESEDKLYELDFLGNLGLPDQFKNEGVVLPTARAIVDTAVDHTDIANARVFVNKKATRHLDSNAATEEQEMQRKFALGLIHRTNVESTISPWRVAAKHFWMHGLGVFKTVWDADRWPDKPEQKSGESDDSYNLRIDEWRSETHKSLPIVIQAINPRCIMPDPSTGGELFVIERHERIVADVMKIWPHWGNAKKQNATEKVVHLSYWDQQYRCELIDEQPVLKVKGGVYKHGYGFCPYTLVESGLGNLSFDALPEKRYVGILRYIKGLLYSESRTHSLTDILIAREVLKGGFITGENAALVGKVDQAYGQWTPLPEGVKIEPWPMNMPPNAVFGHQGNIADYIASHGAPRSVRGMGEEGVRSGTDRRLVIAEASAKYQYSKDAFRHGTENVLAKATMLLKNKIPGDVRVWAHTPTDELDIIIKKDKLKEPFVFFVEFAPISEEDEYRRHDDLERLTQTGIITKEWARQRMSNVDPASMERSEMKERIKMDPMVQQVFSMWLAGQLGQKLSALQPPQMGPQGPQMGAQNPLMGGMTQGPPNMAVPGGAQDLQTQMAGMRSQTPINPMQGMGGGGARV